MGQCRSLEPVKEARSKPLYRSSVGVYLQQDGMTLIHPPKKEGHLKVC